MKKTEYYVEYFDNEYQACGFLNKMERESEKKDNYNGKVFDFKIIAFYRAEKKIVIVYEKTEY